LAIECENVSRYFKKKEGENVKKEAFGPERLLDSKGALWVPV